MIVCTGTSLQQNDSSSRPPLSWGFSDLITSDEWAAECRKGSWQTAHAQRSHKTAFGGGKTVIWVEENKLGHKGWLQHNKNNIGC